MRATLRIVAALAIVFIVLELTTRVHFFGAAGLDPRKVESLRNFRATELVRLSDSAADRKYKRGFGVMPE